MVSPKGNKPPFWLDEGGLLQNELLIQSERLF